MQYDRTVSFSNADTGTSGTYATYFLQTPLTLRQDSKIALSGAFIPNTFVNVAASLNNNTFSWASSGPSGTFNQTVTLLDGTYGVSDINYFLQQSLASANLITSGATLTPLSFSGIGAVDRVQIIVANGLPETGQTYTLTLPAGLAALLGFNAGTFSSTTLALNQANLNNGVLSYQIHCSLCFGNYSGKQQNCDVLYHFTPGGTAVGGIIEIEVLVPQWASVNTTNVTNLVVYLTDQSGNSVNLNGQTWQVALGFHL